MTNPNIPTSLKTGGFSSQRKLPLLKKNAKRNRGRLQETNSSATHIKFQFPPLNCPLDGHERKGGIYPEINLRGNSLIGIVSSPTPLSALGFHPFTFQDISLGPLSIL